MSKSKEIENRNNIGLVGEDAMDERNWEGSATPLPSKPSAKERSDRIVHGTEILTPPQEVGGRKDCRRKTQRPDNSGSRPMKLPLSNRILAVMSNRLPDKLRKILQRNIGSQKVPKNMTFAEGLTLGVLCSPFFNGFNLASLREIRKIAEFEEETRACEPGEQELDEKESDVEQKSLREKVMLAMVRMMMDRKEIYGLEMPKLDAMERKATEEIRKAESQK